MTNFNVEDLSNRHQWPSMWFCLWTLQGIFQQGLSTQTQMSLCHSVSREPMKILKFGMVIFTLNEEHEKSKSGSPAKLYCLAYGFPKPTVTWWKGTTMLPLSSERHRQEEFTLSLRWNQINITCQGRFSGPWHCLTWVLTPARLIMGEDPLHPTVSECRWIAEDRWISWSYLITRCMALCTLHLESRSSWDMW